MSKFKKKRLQITDDNFSRQKKCVNNKMKKKSSVLVKNIKVIDFEKE